MIKGAFVHGLYLRCSLLTCTMYIHPVAVYLATDRQIHFSIAVFSHLRESAVSAQARVCCVTSASLLYTLKSYSWLKISSTSQAPAQYRTWHLRRPSSS